MSDSQLAKNNNEPSQSQNPGNALSQSEGIDTVHSLKSTHRRAKENGNDGMGSLKNQSRSSQPSISSDSDKRSVESDSEPGNPIQPIEESARNHMPYGWILNKKMPAPSPTDSQNVLQRPPNALSNRVKSVQFFQENPPITPKSEIELVVMTERKDVEENKEREGHFKVRRSSAINREIQERQQLVKQQNNNVMLQKIIDPIWGQSISQIINFREGANDSQFAQMWSFLFFLIQTYNFFTAFFFLGIKGQPTGLWYLLEVICEILQVFDFVARWLIRVHFNQTWQQMYLLHDRGGVTSFHFYIRLIASVPYQILISIAVAKNPIVRESIWIASLRLLKLLKFSQVVEYFNAIEFQKRQMKNFSLNKTMFVIYYMLCFLHICVCMICLTGRIDPKPTPQNNLGWFNIIGFNAYQHTIYDIYQQSLRCSIFAMMGLNDGVIYGTTELEWFTLTIWFVAGASLLLGYFSWIVQEFQLRNIQLHDNSFRYELAKQFCDVRSLPSDIRLKIRYYYHNMRINFEEYNEKTKILQNLPQNLKNQIAPLFNSQVLKNIKFLQMAKPEFVSKIACQLQPEVSLCGDFVVKYNEIADKMFFVQDGSLEVLATDHFTTVAFLGAGTYFGEIGVLITGKRSLSIKALTNCMCYSVKSQEFLEILNDFPEQTQFLRAVGYQRLLTTNPSDVETPREYRKERVEEAITEIVQTNKEVLSKLNSERNYDKDISFLRLNSMPDSKRLQNDKIKTKFWLTKQYSSLDYFIIMPFSRAFYTWNAIMIMAFTYVLFVVPYGIGFKEDHGFDPLLIVCQVLFAVDIPLRMRTGITEPKHISTNLQQIFTHYINTWLFYDMLASIPIEYVLQVYYPEISRWIMLLKFFKVFRLYESLQIYLLNTNLGHYYVMFAIYIYFMTALAHILACYMAYVCEIYPKNSPRFDGWSLISKYNTQVFADGDPMKYDRLKKYFFYIYYGTKLSCNQNYGDTNPYTQLEEWGSMAAVFLGRTILAFSCTETTHYLGELYKSQSRQLVSTQYLNQWMKKIKLPTPLINRIKIFSQMTFRYQHQVDESEILEGLPPTLQNNIKSHLFAPLIRTWEAISKENIGEVMSIVNELELVTFPENEYVVKIGEVAHEMYFIVDGLCQVLTAENVQIAVLKQGQNFGEMALLDPNLPMRVASVKTLTNVNLAIITREQFDRISELYPQFRENIQRMVRMRLKSFQESKQSREDNLHGQMLRRLQQSESVSQESSLSESLTDSDFDEEEARLGSDGITVDDQENYDQELKLSVKDGESSAVQGKLKTPNKSLKQQFLGTSPGKKENLESNGNEPLTTDRGLLNSASQAQKKIRPTLKMKQSNNRVVPLNIGLQSQRSVRRQLSGETSNRSRHSQRTSSKGKKSLIRSQTERLHANLAEHQKSSKDMQNLPRTVIEKLKLKSILKLLVQLAVHYNVWFIPIHTAYKFPIQGVWFGLEIATILIYAFELIYRFFQYRHLTRVITMDEQLLSIKDRKLKQDYEKLQNKIMAQKTEFFFTLIAIVPLNLIFDRIGWNQNVGYDVIIMVLRICKIRPIGKIFRVLYPVNLPLFRVMEVIYYNYLFCNFYSVILIDMAIWKPDARQTWLRRLPVIPSMIGKIRESPNIWTDVTPFQLYINAQYYIQSTLSHVAIGDINMTNSQEWLFNAVFMVTSTFIYNYLFANIASIVSNLTSETHVAFLKRRNIILSKIKNSTMPLAVVEEVNLYFDYQFYKYNGLTEKEMTEKLPDRIKLDIQLSQYNSVIERCLLFRKSRGEFDHTLANTFLSSLTTKIYLSENYIVKVGQKFTDSILILEGMVNVCSYHNQENLGLLGPGDFFSTDISDQTKIDLDRNYFQYTQGEGLPRVRVMSKDNFESRSMVHLISKTFVVIGVLEKSNTQVLYKAFPYLKKVFRHCNRYMFDVGRKQVEKSIWEESHEQPTRAACLKKVKDQIRYGTLDFYDEMIRKTRIASLSEQKNMSYILYNYYIVYQPQEERKPLYQAVFGKTKQEYTILPKEQSSSCCCEDAYIEEHSKLKRALRYIHFFNLIYTSFALPFYIAHDVRIRGLVLAIELISSTISFMIFFLNFRTPFIENGEKTLNFMVIAREYFKNGMIVDFFGMLPMNIVLEFGIDPAAKDRAIFAVCLIGIARCTRMFSVMQAVNIFAEIKLDFKKNRFAIQSAGNILFCLLFGHWIVCLWTFTILMIEQNDPNSWWQFQKLYKDPLWSVYLHNWYAVIDITTGAAGGDIYAVTDLERVFFCLMMNCGDIVFAFAFGLINQMVLNSRLDDDTGNFINSMVKIERCLAKFEISSTWKDRIEQFYTYQQKIEISSVDLNAIELEKYLPQSLVKKILYYQYGNLVRPFCEEYSSENLISDICYCLKSKLCMPDDLIMNRGEIGTHIYFVVEGTALILGPDNKQIVDTLEPGSFIGDLATLSGQKRNVSVLAKTFVLIKEISNEEIQNILIQYPEVHEQMKNRAVQGLKKQAIALRAPKILANELKNDILNMVGILTTSDENEGNSDSDSGNGQEEHIPLNANQDSKKSSKVGSISTSFQDEDSVKDINQQLENLAFQKQQKGDKQSYHKARRMTTLIENIGHSPLFDMHQQAENRIQQQTERIGKRNQVSQYQDQNSVSKNVDKQITNRTKQSVQRRLSTVSIGKSLQIKHDQNSVSIKVEQ